RTVEKARGNKNIPFSVFKVTGLMSTALLEKVQAGEKLTGEEKAAYARGLQRVQDICKRCYEADVRVFVDAEESWFQDTIDNMAYDMMELYNKGKAIVYNTYQLYRHDRLDALVRDYENALAKDYILGAKPVRGA